jgi:queuine tRNA-ribosyltransferase
MHNLYFYNNLMTQIRNALDEGRFARFKKDMLESLAGSGD